MSKYPNPKLTNREFFFLFSFLQAIFNICIFFFFNHHPTTSEWKGNICSDIIICYNNSTGKIDPKDIKKHLYNHKASFLVVEIKNAAESARISER